MRKNKIALFFLIVLILSLFSLNTTAKNLKLHFIDVGQGDSILIEIPEGQKILVDGGDRADSITNKIINYLKAQNIKKLDYIISTHPHADHIGGLAAIIDNFEVKNVLDSGKIHTSKTYENYLTKIDQKNISFSTPREGDILKIGKGEINFLHPDSKLDSYSLNNSSLVFVLKFNKQKFLFTGDIERKVELELLQENKNLKIDLIKVPHHGSKSSSYPKWINQLQPKLAIIQVGAANNYGHPAPKVINHYQKLGAAVYRNDLNGNIVVTADGKNYSVKVDHNQKNNKDKIKVKNLSQIKKEQNNNLININKADLASLDQLWGIGPATAKKIIDYREKNNGFKQIEEIKNVEGINEGKFNRWYDQITVK